MSTSKAKIKVAVFVSCPCLTGQSYLQKNRSEISVDKMGLKTLRHFFLDFRVQMQDEYKEPRGISYFIEAWDYSRF